MMATSTTVDGPGEAEVEEEEEDYSVSGRPIEAGALYTIEERLETFKVPYCNWPFDSGPCTPLKMAEAGFYFCGTAQTPDWVRCVVCHHNMEGWEATDNPFAEHKSHVPSCPFLKIKDPYKITVSDVLDLERKALEWAIKLESAKLGEEMDGITKRYKGDLVKAVELAKAKKLDSSQPEQPTV